MRWARTIWTEMLGLFVDDGRFAGVILCWLAVCALALPRLSLPAGVAPAALFAGLVAILLESAVRRAREGRE